MLIVAALNANDTQAHTVNADGLSVTLRLRWRRRIARWALDVIDAQGVTRHRGIWLTHGELPISYGDGLPPGRWVLAGPGSAQVQADMGDSLWIAYVPASELA